LQYWVDTEIAEIWSLSKVMKNEVPRASLIGAVREIVNRLYTFEFKCGDKKIMDCMRMFFEIYCILGAGNRTHGLYVDQVLFEKFGFLNI
jgi:hypothetical protein